MKLVHPIISMARNESGPGKGWKAKYEKHNNKQQKKTSGQTDRKYVQLLSSSLKNSSNHFVPALI